MSRLGEMVLRSVECFPRELARLVVDYAKQIPVQFRHSAGGRCLPFTGVSGDGLKDQKHYRGFGQETFATMGIPFTWRVQVRGDDWVIGTSGNSSSLCLSSDGCVTQYGQEIQLIEPFQELLRIAKTQFSTVLFDISITVHSSLVILVNSVTPQKRHASVIDEQGLEMQKAIDKIVGKAQVIPCDVSYLHESCPYVAVSCDGHAQLIDDD